MPFLIELKISPSVDPCFHSLSVRSGAGGMRSLPDPPSALVPWQDAQYRRKTCCPAAIDSGAAATGFLIFAASGLPCAIITMPVSDAAGMAIRIARRKNARMRDLSFTGPWPRRPDRQGMHIPGVEDWVLSGDREPYSSSTAS